MSRPVRPSWSESSLADSVSSIKEEDEQDAVLEDVKDDEVVVKEVINAVSRESTALCVGPDCPDEDVVSDPEPKPKAVSDWSSEEVGDWIASIGFPDYRECFMSNCIIGRRLILMDASALPMMGISDFKEIREITKRIRELLDIELMPWNRSISLPPKEISATFLERKCKTGNQLDDLTYDVLEQHWSTIKFRPPLSNYCGILSDQL